MNPCQSMEMCLKIGMDEDEAPLCSEPGVEQRSGFWLCAWCLDAFDRLDALGPLFERM